MSNEGDQLIREVQEELRREQLARLWQRYGTWVLGAAAAIVIGVGGYKIWEAQTLAAAQSAGARFESALNLYEQNKAKEADALLQQLAGEGHQGYETLARLRLAGQAAESKRPGDAVALYEQVARDTGADELFREFAVLRIAALKLGEETWTETKNRLTEVAKAGKPWSAAARELIGLAAFKAGKYQEARQALAELVGDSKVPPSISQRAQIMLAMIAANESGVAGAPGPGSGKGGDAGNGAKAGASGKKN
ncbi:MAG: hypothetical protein RLZ98_792 [Pseudomonadota bacterium]|jgi:hypothetical protein